MGLVGVDLGPSLDDRCFALQAFSDNLLVDQLAQLDLSSAELDGGVVPAAVDVKLESVLLEVIHVEFVDLVDKRELRLIVGSGALTHLRRLCAVVVEVNGDHCDELSVHFSCSQVQGLYIGNRASVELCILNFEV